MHNFFIIDNDEVVAVIVADTKEIAETVTGKSAIHETMMPPGSGLGWKLVNDTWEPPQV